MIENEHEIQLLKITSGEELLVQIKYEDIENILVNLPMQVNKVYKVDKETGETIFEAHLENWMAIQDLTYLISLPKKHIISQARPNKFFLRYYFDIIQEVEQESKEEEEMLSNSTSEDDYKEIIEQIKERNKNIH